MHFGERFDPGRDTGRDFGVPVDPAPNEAVIAAKRSRKTSLRPAQRGQTFPQAFGRHGPKNLIGAAVAPISAAPAVIPAITSCQPEST